MKNKILLCPNPYRDKNLKITEKVKGILEGPECDISICPIFDTEIDSTVPVYIEKKDINEEIVGSTLVIVIGGDGTILHCGRVAAKYNIPLIGINAGTKGFMAVLEQERIEDISRVLTKDYKNKNHMLIDVSVTRNGETILQDFAINDAVVHGYGDCIRLTATCDGDKITSFSGDGIILSTPTGSTAYSLSAGGPLVEPTARNIILTPICVHSMCAKSFVLSPNRVIKVVTEKHHDRRAYLSIDGKEGFEIQSDDVLTVKMSELELNMPDFEIKSFYEIAFEKLLEQF